MPNWNIRNTAPEKPVFVGPVAVTSERGEKGIFVPAMYSSFVLLATPVLDLYPFEAKGGEDEERDLFRRARAQGHFFRPPYPHEMKFIDAWWPVIKDAVDLIYNPRHLPEDICGHLDDVRLPVCPWKEDIFEEAMRKMDLHEDEKVKSIFKL